jgi:hypothetical protein
MRAGCLATAGPSGFVDIFVRVGAGRRSAGRLDGRKVGAACDGCKWGRSAISCSTIDRVRNASAARTPLASFHIAGERYR